MENTEDRILTAGGFISGTGVIGIAAVIPGWAKACKSALGSPFGESQILMPAGFSRDSCGVLVDLSAGGDRNLMFGIAFVIFAATAIFYIIRSRGHKSKPSNGVQPPNP